MRAFFLALTRFHLLIRSFGLRSFERTEIFYNIERTANTLGHYDFVMQATVRQQRMILQWCVE